MPDTQRRPSSLLLASGLSVLLVLISFMWQGHKGFNVWDEGFLWYGVQRVLAGETPLLDFMAYDPGRYYWSAALLGAAGDSGSIMGVRASVAVFQAIGLSVGTMLIAWSTPGQQRGKVLFWLIACASLAVWMFPRHKLFDISLSMFLLGALAALAAAPQPRTYVLAGFAVGLAAVFGRNHGLYGAVGSLALMGWLRLGVAPPVSALAGAGLWSAGVIAGFSPIAVMSLGIPGFGAAFLDSVLLLFEQSSTNLPLPVPWPWTMSFEALPFEHWVRGVLTGLFFIGLLAFGVLAIAAVSIRRAMRRPVDPVLAACAFLALPYAHYAFSRADVGHLAHGIYPLLIGCFALLAAARPWVRWTLGLALCSASFWVMYVFHPGWQCQASNACVSVDVSGDTLVMDRSVADDVQLLRELADRYAPNGESFLAAPFWPGAYAVLDRKAPVWEIYPLFARTQSFERREIERLAAAAPAFAIIYDHPLDGREELRYRNTHPLLNDYVSSHFDRVPYDGNPAYQIYRAKETRP
ncbi:MAG: hypothetical protein QM777_20930 [Pseudorhodoferax sp.]